MSISPQATQLYDKVKSVILPAEWSEFAPDVDAIQTAARAAAGRISARARTDTLASPAPRCGSIPSVRCS